MHSCALKRVRRAGAEIINVYVLIVYYIIILLYNIQYDNIYRRRIVRLIYMYICILYNNNNNIICNSRFMGSERGAVYYVTL